MAQIEIPDELYAEIQAQASAEYRTVALQVAYLAARHGERKAVDRDRQRRKRENDKGVTSRDVTSCHVTERDSRDSVTPPSPPSSSLFFPHPSNPNSCPPSPVCVGTRACEDPTPTPPEIPFSLPLEGPSPDDVPEDRGAPHPPIAPGPLPRRAQPAPKPNKFGYSEAFDLWWKARAWGGSKSEAFTEWKSAGLDRDDDLRVRVMAATSAQMANKSAMTSAGARFVAPFKDGCRWLKKGCWDDNLEELPSIPAGFDGLTRAVPHAARPTVAEVGGEWLRRRREAGL